MTTSNIATELRRLVQQLQDERADHVKTIESIDQTFQELKLDTRKTSTKARHRHPTGSNNTANSETLHGKHKTLAVTADTFVLSFVQANPGCTTAQINDHWIKNGRNGKADQTLCKLVKTGQIVRNNIKGQRGSTHTVK
jgi:hypothetical protein